MKIPAYIEIKPYLTTKQDFVHSTRTSEDFWVVEIFSIILLLSQHNNNKMIQFQVDGYRFHTELSSEIFFLGVLERAVSSLIYF